MKYLIFRNHTVEHLFRYLKADYNGYGDLSASTTGYDSLIWFFMPLPNPDTEKVLDEIRSYKRQLEFLIDSNQDKRILIFLLSSRLVTSYLDGDQRASFEISEFNSACEDLSRGATNIQLVSTDDFLNQFSNGQIFDWKYYLMSQTILAPTLARSFKSWFNNKVRGLDNKRKKCLVLDLDNTLWGGVLGEDGIENIQIGDSYPGLAFKTFQEQILEAQRNGVLLAVCSKNNEADVEEAWNNHPFLVLKRDNFSAIRVNWKNKAENIQSIAHELNIGLDSMVFIDDNPTEREIVRQTLPEVSVPEFPEHPYELPDFFNTVWQDNFQVYELTKEDRFKTEQYLENRNRQELEQKFVDFDEYLGSLEIVLKPQMVSEYSIVRVAQMTQKTNQFNLRTQRYDVKDIQTFVNQGDLVYHMAVEDKFGDSGITLLAIICLDEQKASIDSFLLSCRILGKRIEEVFFKFLMNILIGKGIQEVRAEFIPTKKNQQTKEFYEGVGMKMVEQSEDGGKKYTLNLKEHFELSEIYRIEG